MLGQGCLRAFIREQCPPPPEIGLIVGFVNAVGMGPKVGKKHSG